MNAVFPSILSTNFFNLKEKLDFFDKNRIRNIHLDVMDGHFVDNISFGPSILKAIKSTFSFQVDAHLMVTTPLKMIPWFLEAGADWISFHIEALDPVSDCIELIRRNGKKAGLVLNPDSDVSLLRPYLSEIDYILLMSVFPGYGGQSFIPATLERIEELSELLRSGEHACLIQVDGGINEKNIKTVKKRGADLFVIGTTLFNASNPEKTLRHIQDAIKNGE